LGRHLGEVKEASPERERARKDYRPSFGIYLLISELSLFGGLLGGEFKAGGMEGLGGEGKDRVAIDSRGGFQGGADGPRTDRRGAKRAKGKTGKMKANGNLDH
jgi:hypothetical protein